MSALLELQGVTAGYVEDIDILQDVSLRIDAGGIVGLIGLNGAGKSTIMKAVYGFLHPRAGRIVLAGEDITGSAPHTLIDRGVFYIPQESSLFPYMSVEDNLSLPLQHLARSTGQPAPAEMDQRLADTYDRFPVLRERRQTPAGNLSGGQQTAILLVDHNVRRVGGEDGPLRLRAEPGPDHRRGGTGGLRGGSARAGAAVVGDYVLS